ncbi:MAG: pyridoxal phosphate-dependent aminotransferase [Nitrososphaeria archaeon]|nr:aminotransferase class I/II-fold pyridoxal phosphate-dependent enzyme [Conexivisphaerales archaeon]
MSWKSDLEKWYSVPVYKPGISPEESKKIVGDKNFLNLQSNENLFIPSELIKKLAENALLNIDLRLYPKEITTALTEKLAKINNLEKENVILGHGADQMIESVLNIFRNKKKVFLHKPTYSYYKIAAMSYGLKVITDEYVNETSLNFESINKSSPDLVFICNPNNPTGHVIPKGEIEELLKNKDIVVVLDETYAEISGVTSNQLLNDYENLIILRTFSKAYGLAGLRIGYALASGILSDVLKRVQSPFPVSSFSAYVALLALDRIEVFKKYWNEALKVREWFEKQLDEGVIRSKSSSYFLTLSFKVSSEAAFTELLSHGYITRVIEPFGRFLNPLRMNLAPKDLIEDLPGLINQINKN